MATGSGFAVLRRAAISRSCSGPRVTRETRTRKTPVDRESSRVQAVACFFPPADLLNYGQPGKEMIHATDHGLSFRPAFDYRELDKKTNVWVTITDTERLLEITRQISPITHVSRR